MNYTEIKSKIFDLIKEGDYSLAESNLIFKEQIDIAFSNLETQYNDSLLEIARGIEELIPPLSEQNIQLLNQELLQRKELLEKLLHTAQSYNNSQAHNIRIRMYKENPMNVSIKIKHLELRLKVISRIKELLFASEEKVNINTTLPKIAFNLSQREFVLLNIAMLTNKLILTDEKELKKLYCEYVTLRHGKSNSELELDYESFSGDFAEARNGTYTGHGGWDIGPPTKKLIGKLEMVIETLKKQMGNS